MKLNNLNIISYFKLLYSLLLIFLITIPTNAQKEINVDKKDRLRFGFFLAIADQKFGELDLKHKYDYRLIMFQSQFNYRLISNNSFQFDLILIPQYNQTFYKKNNEKTETSRGFEYGLNTGFQVSTSVFTDILSLYLMASTGPHFTSGVPERQASGFLFSNNFMLGLSIKVKEKIRLNIHHGFRHISNLDFKKPNGGINNLIIGSGIQFTL